MGGYADPELRVAEWLHDRLDYKFWADPRLPSDLRYTAPIGHVQRGQSPGDTVLTLDDCLIDVDMWAANADHARAAAEQVRTAMRLHLPHYTWPDGVTVSGTFTITAPFWAPDPTLFRRSATYRVVLHGLLPD